MGYDVKLILYSGFPGNTKGDKDKVVKCYRITLSQAGEMLIGMNLNDYGDILFIGKNK